MPNAKPPFSPNEDFNLSNLKPALLRDPAAVLGADTERYEAQIRALADSIPIRNDKHTVILLAGPSGSGKTTTAEKIAKALKARGAGAMTVSLDNFYLGRGQAPRHEDGTYDYESVHALDLPLLHDVLLRLIKTGKCLMPRFDFRTGSRAPEPVLVELPENGIAVVEGIHAMNPLIVETLPRDCLRTVYISVARGFVDESGRQILSPRAVRLVRRMVRDSIFRNSDAQNTLDMWVSVVRGEEKYLEPFKDLAEFSVDSTHACEPALFKAKAAALCRAVRPEHPGSETARALTAALERFPDFDEDAVPPDSLMREFLGGGDFS